jgi:hypothetical protein
MTYPFVKTAWFRWYTRWSSNWVRSKIGEKQFIVQWGNGPQNTSAFIGHVQWASAPLVQYTHDPSAYYYPNAPVPAINFTNWNCYEARLTLNSAPTVSDGALEFYVNGSRITNATNIRLATFSNAVHFQTLLSAYYNCTTANCQGAGDAHPAMQRWHDNFVVATQRVGCLGTPPPPPSSPPPPPPAPTQPPAAPSNLILR